MNLPVHHPESSMKPFHGNDCSCSVSHSPLHHFHTAPKFVQIYHIVNLPPANRQQHA
jgi:hypothetical protein